MIDRTRTLRRALVREAKLPVNPVNKVTWQKVGHVTEPGRYMFRFGWLTIVPDDLAIWAQFPEAAFTLVQTSAPSLAAEHDRPPDDTDEFHLGAFELPVSSSPSLIGSPPTDDMPLEAQSSV
jgi:hypothetical protein